MLTNIPFVRGYRRPPVRIAYFGLPVAHVVCCVVYRGGLGRDTALSTRHAPFVGYVCTTMCMRVGYHKQFVELK